MAPGNFRPGWSSFTLVEVIVSLAILSIILVVLIQAITFAQVSFTYLGNAALRRQDATLVLSNMARDLRSSLQPMNRSYEGAETASGQFQFLINPASIPTNSGLCNPNTLFWSANIPNSAGGTGLVGYVVNWGTTSSGAPQPLLCRMFLNSAQAAPQLALLQSAANVTNQWTSTSLVGTYAPANLSSGYQGWLADNVLALYARALDPNMNPITNYARTISGLTSTPYYMGGLYATFGTTTGTSCTNQYDSRRGYQYYNSGGFTNVYGPALPAAIELAIVAADPRDIARLSSPVYAISTYNASQDMWTNINTYMTNLPSYLQKSATAYSTIIIP